MEFLESASLTLFTDCHSHDENNKTTLRNFFLWQHQKHTGKKLLSHERCRHFCFSTFRFMSRMLCFRSVNDEYSSKPARHSLFFTHEMRWNVIFCFFSSHISCQIEHFVMIFLRIRYIEHRESSIWNDLYSLPVQSYSIAMKKWQRNRGIK